MESLKVVFKNGVFVPVEPVSIPEGTEGIVVYSARSEMPRWWELLGIDDEKKGALRSFVEGVRRRVEYREIKVVEEDGEFEVFLLTEDEGRALKPAMEEALRVYEETGVYIPLQVISERRLRRWREMGNPVYERIEGGISVG